MEEKNVLIITYYWPPSGGSGVQRWLKFVKYLPLYGYTPIVFTPENPAYPVLDESLAADVPPEAEIIRFPIWEPYEAFFRLSRIAGEKRQGGNLVASGKKTLFQRVSTWIRGNLLIPDPRVFWVRPSVAFLADFIRENRIQTIITTGPPHSVHLIGYRLKKKFPSLRWLADFRDPWSEWGLLDSLAVTRPVRAIHRWLERRVLATASEIITITPFYARRFGELSKRKVRLLTNGFDEDDFTALQVRRTEKFVIRHVGIVNEKCDPRPFMASVKSLAAADPAFFSDVQIDFTGDVHPAFRRFVEDDATLRRVTSFTPPVPHKELIHRYGASSVLLLVLTGYKDAEGYMPGKLFEYAATGLPVLGVGPVDGDAAAMMRSFPHHRMIDSYDAAGIAAVLREFYAQWKSGGHVAHEAGAAYSRRAITAALAELL